MIFTTDDVDKLAEMCEHKIRSDEEGLVVFEPKEVCVLTTQSDPAQEFAKDSGIKTKRLGNAGGCIVAFPGNVEVGFFSKNLDNDFIERTTSEAIALFKRKGLEVVQDNNDILVDGYKVFSTSKASYNHSIIFCAVHISINCDTDLVRKICTKPMVKIPKGLSEYGITTEEMFDLIVGMYNEGHELK
jgi:hypothetical protein